VAGTTSIVRLTEEDGGPVVWAREIGVLFHIDAGPADPGSRARALHALEGILKRASGYHQKRAKQEKGGNNKAKGPDEDLDLEALRPLFRGEVRALVRAGRADAVLNAVDLFAGMKIKPVIVGGEEADRVASEIAGRVAGVILGPDLLALREGRWENRAALLAEAGIPVLFGSFQEGGAEALGLTAAFAVRHGLGEGEALAALTGGVGEVLGFGEDSRPGVLRRGAPADLVVFSGDPFLATSRVRLVVAGGDIRHPAEGGVQP
jgi:imidazolonepropionase-like amidohydrolase